MTNEGERGGAVEECDGSAMNKVGFPPKRDAQRQVGRLKVGVLELAVERGLCSNVRRGRL